MDLVIEIHPTVRARLSRDRLTGLLPWNVRRVVLLEGIESTLIHDCTRIRGVWGESSLSYARAALGDLPSSVVHRGVWYLQAPESCLPRGWDTLGDWVDRLYRWAEGGV